MPETPPLQLTWTCLSEIGARASNQDALGQSQHGATACFVVADGAGGHEGGEVAAGIVVDAVLARFAQAPQFGAAALRDCLTHASANVALAQRAEARRHAMSATVAALLIEREAGRAVWAHLGDTRVYLFRDGLLHMVSKDHSLTQQLIDAGYARYEQLRSHPQRNILFAAIGAEGGTTPAVGETLTLQAGDTFLLCSDGLWEWVPEADMERALATANDCAGWLDALCVIAAANVAVAGKARDNFSAYAITVGTP